MDQEPSKENRQKEPANRVVTQRIWSCLWRGGVGGFFGVFIFFGYAGYKNPYGIIYLGSSLPFLWIAIIAGLLVGAVVWLFGGFRDGNLGLLLRVAIGVAVSLLVIAPYMYWTQYPGDIEPWWKYSLVFGFSIGVVAGILAQGRFRHRELSGDS